MTYVHCSIRLCMMDAGNLESSLPFKPLNWSHMCHIEGLKVKQE